MSAFKYEDIAEDLIALSVLSGILIRSLAGPDMPNSDRLSLAGNYIEKALTECADKLMETNE